MPLEVLENGKRYYYEDTDWIPLARVADVLGSNALNVFSRAKRANPQIPILEARQGFSVRTNRYILTASFPALIASFQENEKVMKHYPWLQGIDTASPRIEFNTKKAKVIFQR